MVGFVKDVPGSKNHIWLGCHMPRELPTAISHILSLLRTAQLRGAALRSINVQPPEISRPQHQYQVGGPPASLMPMMCLAVLIGLHQLLPINSWLPSNTGGLSPYASPIRRMISHQLLSIGSGQLHPSMLALKQPRATCKDHRTFQDFRGPPSAPSDPRQG